MPHRPTTRTVLTSVLTTLLALMAGLLPAAAAFYYI